MEKLQTENVRSPTAVVTDGHVAYEQNGDALPKQASNLFSSRTLTDAGDDR
jgi:hypothetical protein